MIHDGNRIFGHPRSEESIKLIISHLVTLHDDCDDNSLFVRFSELIGRAHDLEVSSAATWECYVKTLVENKKLKDERITS